MVVRIPMRTNGYLSKQGYVGVKSMTKLARHRDLSRVIKSGEPPLGLFRRLNVLMILFKNKDPKLSKLFKNDRDWIKKKFLKPK